MSWDKCNRLFSSARPSKAMPAAICLVSGLAETRLFCNSGCFHPPHLTRSLSPAAEPAPEQPRA